MNNMLRRIRQGIMIPNAQESFAKKTPALSYYTLTKLHMTKNIEEWYLSNFTYPFGAATLLRPLVKQIRESLFDWGCSSVGRAPDLHSGGLGFNSPQLHIFIIIT